MCCCVFFFKQKTAYEMRISDWSSDVCSSDLLSRYNLLSDRKDGSEVMCSHYQTVKDQKRIEKYFRARGITTPNFDIWPDKPGLFIRRPLEWESDDDAIPEREVVIGRWGLISRMTKADGLARPQTRSTFNEIVRAQLGTP